MAELDSTRDAGEYMQGELFSEHYIADRLRDSQRFIDMTGKADEAFRIVSHIYEQKKDILERLDEHSLEDDFLKPVLAALEHVTDVQPPYLSHKGMEDIPDYALFNDEGEKQTAQRKKDVDSDTYFDVSIGLIEAKRWDKNLDRGRRRTPSVQIKRYLRMTTVKWGILTNGRKWRLYCKESPFSSNVFLEFDLQRMLEHDRAAMFRLFYAFFSHDAFRRVDGRSFLDAVYEKNIRFAREVEDDLERNVYEALRVLVEGFLRFEPNGLDRGDVEDIHDSCLILLYRLLFLFYAESKDLIQFSSHYRKYSLIHLSEKIAADMDEYAPLVDDYWQTLQRTFAIINRGSEEVVGEAGIPPYNGGLFDPDRHPFLERYSISDNYLKMAVELLARRQTDTGRQWVDYKTLQIRHLGSIYEKLLEYKVRVAETDLAVDDGEYHAAEEDEDAVVEEGELYLVTDKGERKATGSYYTPDYVVEYIVENTVGELIDERTGQARQDGESEADAILDITVLDPAMGSGHFLVGAVEYMADELVEAVNRDIENEVWDEGDRDHDWAKRAVVSHCIYGVDVNPLAVELAKLSLWLTTLSKGKPLSFLDHRLKCGNSLIGERLEDLPVLPGDERTQDRKIHTPFIDKLADQAAEIEDIPDDSLSDIKRKEQLYRQLRDSDAYKRIKTLADARTAIYFGVGDDHPELKDRYKNLAWEALMGDASKWEDKSRASWVREGREMARRQRFFHWELEFPDVFFGDGETGDNRKTDSNSTGGFDAVIGNPPYVRQEQLGKNKEYLSESYSSYHGMADLYVYFFEKGHELLKRNGLFGYISSNKFIQAGYGKNLRSFLTNGIFVKEIVDFGELPVFPEAATFPAIFITEKSGREERPTTYTKVKSLDFVSLEQLVDDASDSLLPSCFQGDTWNLVSEREIRIVQKMDRKGVPLEQYVDGNIEYGIKTGLNDVFVIDRTLKDDIVSRDPASSEIIKPALAGDDIRRYKINFRDRYVIFTRRGIDLEKYPGVKEYLNQYKESLIPKPEGWDDKHDGEWKGRKPGSYEWYEIQDTVDYYEAFEKPKIVFPDIAMNSRFAFDNDKRYVLNTGYVIPVDDFFLLAILNSTLIESWYRHNSAVLGDADMGGRMRFIYQYVSKIPIKEISYDTPEPERKKLTKDAQDHYRDYLTNDDTEIFELIDALLPQADREQKSDVAKELLASLARKMTEYKQQRDNLNLNVLDYLGNYVSGNKLSELSTPPQGLSSTILVKTATELDNLRIGSISFDRNGKKLVLYATARYKPENPDKHDTDRWGYTETETIPAMEFLDLTETEKALVEAFVPLAIEKSGGFAGFRENATKTKSLIDRLGDLTLPKLDDVESSFKKYLKIKGRADELDKKIRKTDELIDHIVYRLYGLTDEEIDIIEKSLD